MLQEKTVDIKDQVVDLSGTAVVGSLSRPSFNTQHCICDWSHVVWQH